MKVQEFVNLFAFFYFYSLVRRDDKIHETVSSFSIPFLITGLLAGIRWSVYISKAQRILCVSFSRTDSDFCIYHLVVWSNTNFLHNSQWITFPTQSWRVLYSFWVSLLHLLIMGLTVSFLSSHNLHLLFCCILSMFPLI